MARVTWFPGRVTEWSVGETINHWVTFFLKIGHGTAWAVVVD